MMHCVGVSGDKQKQVKKAGKRKISNSYTHADVRTDRQYLDGKFCNDSDFRVGSLWVNENENNDSKFDLTLSTKLR